MKATDGLFGHSIVAPLAVAPNQGADNVLSLDAGLIRQRSNSGYSADTGIKRPRGR